MEMEARARTGVEEAAQQAQRLAQRAEVADDDAQLALLAHRELRRVVTQPAELAEKDPRARMKGAPRLGQPHAIAAAVEEAEAQLRLEVLHRGEHRGMRAAELRRGGLEAAFGDHGVEALELVEGEAVHCRISLQ